MKVSGRPGGFLSGVILAYSLVHAAVNVAWLIGRGSRVDTVRGAAFGVGLPAAAEVWITALDRLLTHRMSPQVFGVPLAIPLLWFNVIFGSLATVEAALQRLGFSDEEVEALSAPATALTAVSLDLVMDCFGLDAKLWEWRLGGPYAPDIVGANGARGIPVINFVGWISLVWAVVYLFQKTKSEEKKRIVRLEKTAIIALLPYYLVSATWALQSRRWRFLFYSAAFPVVVLAALTRRG